MLLRSCHRVRMIMARGCLMLSTQTSEAIEGLARVTIAEVESGIFHVQLNRPEKMNALDIDMFKVR